MPDMAKRKSLNIGKDVQGYSKITCNSNMEMKKL